MLVIIAIIITAVICNLWGEEIETALRAADAFCDRAERWVHEG